MNHLKVTIGSLWDYDRSLDNADFAKALEVINIEHDLGTEMITFRQEMPYKRYGISYFDGRTFKPHIPENEECCPFCMHSLKDNFHKFDITDIDFNVETKMFEHKHICKNCKECNK